MRCVDMTGSGKRWLMVVALGLMLPSLGLGKIIYVDDDAAMGGDGRSWDSAFQYLHDAITVSETNDEIRIAQGLYKPDQGRPASWTTTSFRPYPHTLLSGGYAGLGALDPNERDIHGYPTILSGDLKGMILSCQILPCSKMNQRERIMSASSG